MLKFYYHPLSPLARRVWLALLEKKLDFESIIVNLDQGEQLKPEFLSLNPFHHVPVIVDGGAKVIESLAILDYLDCKYPETSLLPTEPKALARVKMAQMVTNSELGSQVVPLVFGNVEQPKKAKATKHLKRVCRFLSELLAEDLYFGGDRLTNGDIVAGNGLILIEKLGLSLEPFPNLKNYTERLMEREPWQIAQPTMAELNVWVEVVRGMTIGKIP